MANDSTSGASGHSAPEPHDEREHAYREHLARLFGQRARVLLSLALLVLPAFALAHAMLCPPARYSLGLTHASLLLVCALARELAPFLRRLRELRILALACYATLFAGAAVVCVQLGALGPEAPLASQLVALGFFVLIELTIPALAFSTRDLAAIVTCALASTAVAAGSTQREFSRLHLFCFSCTLSVAVFLALRSQARQRQAFDAAWHLGLSDIDRLDSQAKEV